MCEGGGERGGKIPPVDEVLSKQEARDSGRGQFISNYPSAHSCY